MYTVLKFHIREIIESNYELNLSGAEIRQHQIKQQDNMMFRQIRLITGEDGDVNPYVFFIDAGGGQSLKDEIRHIVFEGITLNGRKFYIGERSASMTRTGILSMIDESIYEELDKRVTMDITFDKIVLSKYKAYKGLFFSSCHMLEGWLPKMIVVPDYETVIPDQKIKYVYDETTEFVDSNGNKREWTQKAIACDIRDVDKYNAFDGCGICHPELSEYIQNAIGSKTPVTSFIMRAPYIKGCVHAVDYTRFFKERGVEFITDCWGVQHSVEDKMFILTESMYKGLKYFKTYGDARDWDLYLERFNQYDHVIGIAKWNFTVDEEPVYTRSSYQILQDLELPYEKFRTLADDSVKWAQKIIDGDELYTYCFLGMLADNAKPKNDYIKAALKNPEILKEHTVRRYLINLLNKYRNEMKAGKLWLKSTFKFLAPDLIMLLEWIGGLELNGSLEKDEFFTFSKEGVYEGEYLIERNPHICKSEHVILNAVNKDIINEYCGHLSNVCMVNCKSITPQRLNGAD